MSDPQQNGQNIARLLVRQQELEAEVKALRAALLEAREHGDAAAERIEGQLAQLQSRTIRLERLIQSILQSRIWQTLVAAGGCVMSVQAAIARLANRKTGRVRRTAAGGGIFELECDEPRSRASGVYSGTVLFRGWALASTPVSRVEIQAGEAIIEARCGLYRPDILNLYPALPHAERCGWQAHLDTAGLSSGPHAVKVRAIAGDGARHEIEVPLRIDHSGGHASPYYRWIAEFEKRDPALIELKLASFDRKPLVSVLLPVYRTDAAILEKTIASVRNQSYPNWELCIADDGSQSPELDALLARQAAGDSRIKVVKLPDNRGICRASQAALELATGEFVALLDHDDELAQDALFHFVDAFERHPDAGIFYSDEDHIDEAGFRSDPFFKPDWSPDLILTENYVCHLMILRRDLCEAAGGFRAGYDLSQDHDLLLRVSRRTSRIVHIPRVLYHWRTEIYSMSRASNNTEKALDSSRRAVEDHLRALGAAATVEPGLVPPRWRVRYAIPGNPRVRIIIPCGGKVDLLRRCLESVTAETSYPHYDLAVLDNSRADDVRKLVHSFNSPGHTLDYHDFRNQPFNFSKMNNSAARDCGAPLLLFLNDDITVLNAGWLEAMVELACRPEVGAVGAKLLYPDGTIQHAGVVVGLLGLCGHAFKGLPADQRRYFDFPDIVRNVSAVTGACMMAPARLFWECGGFDEEAFPVAYQDIDLCLKLGAKGYRILYTPHAQLYHHEAVSKRPEDKDPRPAETRAFRARWRHVMDRDPFYSTNLTRTSEDYSYARKILAGSAD